MGGAGDPGPAASGRVRPSVGGPPGFFRRHRQKLVAGALWALVASAYLTYTLERALTPLAALGDLLRFLTDNPYGPLVFVVAYLVRPLLLFSATLMTLAAGALFGPVLGVVYTVIGANLGASLAYALGAVFGRDAPAPGAGTRLGRYLGRMRRNSFETVLLMRLLFLPYDLVNYLAGFLRIDFRAFLLATALGSLPATVSVVLLGAATGLAKPTPGFDWRVLALSIAIFALSLTLSQLLKRRERSSHARPTP